MHVFSANFDDYCVEKVHHTTNMLSLFRLVFAKIMLENPHIHFM